MVEIESLKYQLWQRGIPSGQRRIYQIKIKLQIYHIFLEASVGDNVDVLTLGKCRVMAANMFPGFSVWTSSRYQDAHCRVKLKRPPCSAFVPQSISSILVQTPTIPVSSYFRRVLSERHPAVIIIRLPSEPQSQKLEQTMCAVGWGERACAF